MIHRDLHCDHRRPWRQRGIALLALVLLLALAVSASLLYFNSPFALRRQRDKITDDVLAKAKEALLVYAANYSETHANKLAGFLPCPDTGPRGINVHEGSPVPPCGNKGVSAVGRLPWYELGLGPLRDSDGECLWYAVSGSFKNDPAPDMLNWDSDGQLSVVDDAGNSLLLRADGEERAAAVIFAPGLPLATQSRAASGQAPLCGGHYLAADYLDHSHGIDNASMSSLPNGLTKLIASTEAESNDRLLTITAREVFALIKRRSDFRSKTNAHLERLAHCIAAYGQRNAAGPADSRLPWAAPVILDNYASNDRYADAAGLLAGRLPYRVTSSRLATHNGMASSTLLSSDNCPPPWSPADDEWYKNWKDHLFYAVAAAFAPTAAAPGVCGPCLTVNGSGRYAAILIFAAEKLAEQKRATAADRSNIGNYLEARNATNYPNTSGSADYRSAPADAGFNDVLYCLDTALRVAPCS